MAHKEQQYFCKFKIVGGGFLIVPYLKIKKIKVDPETLRSDVYLDNDPTPIKISNTPEEIFNQTNQLI